MPDKSVTDSRHQDTEGHPSSGPQHRHSAVILQFSKENKTRTNIADCSDDLLPLTSLSAELGLRRAWRQVVDFGDPKSSGIGDFWGFKTVSVPWVSILNAPDWDDQPP